MMEVEKKEKTSLSMEETHLDIKRLRDLFYRKKKKLISSILINIFFVLGVMAIVGTQLFYPYHFILGMGIYILSWGWFMVYLWKAKSLFKEFHSYEFAQSFYRKRKFRILLGILFIVALWLLQTMFPQSKNPFKGLNSVEIEHQLVLDKARSAIVMDLLEVSAQEVIEDLEKKDPISLRNSWDDFILSVFLSEDLTEKYKSFYRLEGRNQKDAFILTYGLYLRKQFYVHKIINQVQGNLLMTKVMNDVSSKFEGKDLFYRMSSRFYDPQTMVRINAGRAYLVTLDSSEEWGKVFISKAEGAYSYLRDNLGETLYQGPSILKDVFEKNIFVGWFPVQKNIANVMGGIRLTGRDKGFITQDQISVMEKQMQPGDIMVQRRNWYLSNVGIPGFWAHAALYTGGLKEMDLFFAELFPYLGYENYSDYLKEIYPDIWRDYTKGKDDMGYGYSVIEAIAEGVILTSVEQSADADFVAVLRPNISKIEILEGLMSSFANRGKPYDYNFDFDTNDSFVCSELVYKSYSDYIDLPTNLLNGRKLMAPVGLVQKYDQERGREYPDLSFVYFLKGDEVSQTASISDEETFHNSWTWPKFSFRQ